jgi:hypothetical protein
MLPCAASSIADSRIHCLEQIEQPRSRLRGAGFFVNLRAGNTPDCLEIVQYREDGRQRLTNAAIQEIRE